MLQPGFFSSPWNDSTTRNAENSFIEYALILLHTAENRYIYMLRLKIIWRLVHLNWWFYFNIHTLASPFIEVVSIMLTWIATDNQVFRTPSWLNLILLLVCKLSSALFLSIPCLPYHLNHRSWLCSWVSYLGFTMYRNKYWLKKLIKSTLKNALNLTNS